MNRERLEQVVRVLEELPPEKKFDLDFWNICGTAGCAVGWAASDPWFIERGLHLRKLRVDKNGNVRYQPVISDNGIRVGWFAVTKFFGISYDESQFLFAQDEYDKGTKDDVVERIEEFIG